MTRKENLLAKRENLKQQITSINKQIQLIDAADKKREQAALLQRLKASGLLDKSPAELERLIELANTKTTTGKDGE